MNVTFYTFSKRVNSTAQPVSGTDYTVILKEPSSVISPRLDLIWSGTGSPTAFNYAYISDFGRYYWVTNWEYHDRKWTATLSVDVLASWKTEIGASAKYVLRSASESDPNVFDNYYPVTAAESLDVVAESSGWTPMFNTGCYVLNVAGYQNENSGLGVTLFQQTAQQAYDTIKLAYDDIDAIINNQTSVTDAETALLWLGETMIKAGTDLSKYINGYMWFPQLFDPTGTAKAIKLGFVDGGYGIPITGGTFIVPKDLSLPAWTQSVPKWKACAPYTTYTLDFMPFGTIPLDSVALVNYGGVHVLAVVDAFTGVGVLRVFAGTTVPYGPLLAIRTAQVGIPVQFGANKVDLGQAAASVISGVAQTVSGAAAGDALTAGSGVASAALAIVPDVATAGQTGNIASIGDTIRLYVRHLDPTGEDPTEHGKPLCNLRSINTLSGYVLCQDGEISAPATDGELRQIESYLTGGFFYD